MSSYNFIRKSKQEDSELNPSENQDRWLVSYADFITLLFAFFVVMYATSNNNLVKQKEFQKSVRLNLKLKNPTSAVSPHADLHSGSPNPIGLDNPVDVVIPLEGFPARSGPIETHDYLNRFVEKRFNKSQQDKIKEIRHDLWGVRIVLKAEEIFIEKSFNQINPSGIEALDKIAEILKQSERKIIIEAHTSDTVILKDSPFKSHWQMTSMQANTILEYYINKHQIDPQKLSAVSYGSSRPIDSNLSVEGQKNNNRIEIYILLDEEMQDR